VTSIVYRDPSRGVGRLASGINVTLVEAPYRSARIHLISPLVYVTFEGKRLVVPAGFVCDGASIPSALWVRLGHPLAWANAAMGIVHDHGYRMGERPREEVDMLAWDMALLGGHPDELAAEIHAGVAIWGGAAWEANAQKRAACQGDTARLLAWV